MIKSVKCSVFCDTMLSSRQYDHQVQRRILISVSDHANDMQARFLTYEKRYKYGNEYVLITSCAPTPVDACPLMSTNMRDTRSCNKSTGANNKLLSALKTVILVIPGSATRVDLQPSRCQRNEHTVNDVMSLANEQGYNTQHQDGK